MKVSIMVILNIIFSGAILSAQKNPHRLPKSPELTDMVNRSYLPYIIQTSAEIGLFELLKSNSKTTTEIAKELSTMKEPTDALLGVLSAVEILEYNNGKYNLSKITSDFLIESSKENQLGWLKKNIAIPSGKMAELKNVLKKESMKTFDSKWQNKEDLIQMGERIGKSADIVADFFESLPEFSKCSKMIDYCGSVGYYAMATLERNPKLKAHVYDLQVVCDIAKDIQKDNKNFKRITFHSFNKHNNDPIGSEYDLFFVSNALYHERTKEQLLDFFTQANKSMKIGGVVVSNHWTSNHESDDYLSMTVRELQKVFVGLPIHYLEEETLKQVLKETGFDNFTIQIADKDTAKPRLLIAARKIKELK